MNEYAHDEACGGLMGTRPPASSQIKSPRALYARGDRFSGADRDRTDDLIIANDALYQLSYRPGALAGTPS